MKMRNRTEEVLTVIEMVALVALAELVLMGMLFL